MAAFSLTSEEEQVNSVILCDLFTFRHIFIISFEKEILLEEADAVLSETVADLYRYERAVLAFRLLPET